MIDQVWSLLVSGGVGGILKIISALAQASIDRKTKDYELEKEKIELLSGKQLEHSKTFYGDDTYEKIGDVEFSFLGIKVKYPKYIGGSATFTRWTRRLLACAIVGTYCYLLMLWGANPDVEIAVWNPTESGTFDILWGLISFPAKAGEIIRITTGSLVWGMTNVLTMILTAYFMPIGNK